MQVNNQLGKIAYQNMVILWPNISNGIIPPKKIQLSRFSSTFGLTKSIKNFWDLLFSARMTSSNLAHLAQDFGLIQAHSRSRKQLASELKGPSHSFLLVIDLLTLS